MRSLRALSAVVVIVSLVATAALALPSVGGDAPHKTGPARTRWRHDDRRHGQAPIRDSVVLIRGQRIEKIATTASLPVPDGYEAVSTEGLTVLPGLWDLHVHLIVRGPSDTRYWFDTYTPQFERVIMPASAEQLLMAARDKRPRSCGAAAANSGRQEAHRQWRNPRADTVRGRSGTDERREPEPP
jgi:hypothetical protein